MANMNGSTPEQIAKDIIKNASPKEAPVSEVITITLTAEEVQRLKGQYTQYMGESLKQFAHRVFAIGLTQKEYRKDYNKKNAQERKEFRAWKRQQQQ